MTEIKRKQAEQLIKKASKNRKRTANLLMCGAILSTTVLPLTTVFASTLMDKQPTEQTESPTVDSSVEETIADTTSVFSDTYQETVQETNDEEPDFDVVEQTPVAEEPKEDLYNGMTDAQVEQMKENELNKLSPITGNDYNWVLVDGYYYKDGDTANNPVLDVTINFTDLDNGTVVGSYKESKYGITNGMNVILESAGVNSQEYSIQEDMPLVDYGYPVYDEDGNLVGYEAVSFGYEDMTTDGNGNFIYNVPVKKYVKEEVPTPEEVSFTVSYVDENNKQISETDTYTGEEGEEYWFIFPEFYGYKFAEGQAVEMQGTYEKGMANVTVHYVKDDGTNPSVEMGTVTVKHVDIDTGKEIATPDTITDEVGMGYWASEKEIEGYDFVEEFDEDGSSLQRGTITAEPQTHELHYKSNGEATPPVEDSKLRPVLVQAIKDAKPFVNKDKYQAKYVDILDEAIKRAEQALIDNPEPQTRTLSRNTELTDIIFQNHIDELATAVADVKAHPVDNGGTTDPEVQSEGVTINFWYSMGSYILKTVHLDGKVGEKYNFTDIPETFTHEGLTLYLIQEQFETIKDQLSGTFSKDLKEINIMYNPKGVTPSEDGSLQVIFYDQDGNVIKDDVWIEGENGTSYDLSKYTDIKGYTFDKSKSSALTGTLQGNSQAVLYFTKVDEGNTGGNGSDNGGNTGNGDNGNNSDGDTDNNSGSNSGNTNSNGADTNNSGNGSSSNNTPSNNNSNTGSSNNTNNSTNTTQTSATEGLPQTGESSNPWLTASGIVTMASTALAWVLKRKHG
ncbi:MucBP domain-containing protein [Vagococcus zengguangii]|uniref:MucBP domain-containing protein n=1 Tax=Vagococcus zengguangii TaxID=2571750 RepID=UPI001108E324|nr:MucBP domain-containing protein [Vagococcus zengguangii]TLG78301.1 LPXTG cell wall anchor domain-containing protein [Vagococcus zengguangii]